MAKVKEKVIAMCSPYPGHIVAATDKGAIIVVPTVAKLVEELKKLNK